MTDARVKCPLCTSGEVYATTDPPTDPFSVTHDKYLGWVLCPLCAGDEYVSPELGAAYALLDDGEPETLIYEAIVRLRFEFESLK